MDNWNQLSGKEVSLREQLVKSGSVKDADFQKALSEISGLKFVETIEALHPDFQTKYVESISIRFSKKHIFYPYDFSETNLVLAALTPWPDSAFEETARTLGFDSYSVVLATEDTILAAINQGYDRSSGSAEEAADVLVDDADLNYLSHFSSEETEDLLDVEDEEPIKKLMNSIIFQSVKDNSSDIHIDPSPKETVVRNRIDGELHQITRVPKQGHIPLVNRIKVMSGLDISTKSQPQDGRTMILLAGKKIDIRVSIIPTVHGEQAVLRLLNQSQGIIPLKDLGMNQKMSKQIEALIHQPHGILLVTGPTGSGKTTTLYSALNRIDADRKNIVTIEDPVEYRISKYGQMQVNEKTGVTFSKGLRAMLRQDPDVIMIGEMRDSETAQIAIQSALTGHLVLSTLHTNDAASTIVRMIDMGIEPYLVSSTVSAVLAQRLIRKICSKCKESYSISWSEIKELNLDNVISKQDFKGVLWRGAGCSACLNTGYQGRIGIYELLIIDDEIRRAVNKVVDSTIIRQIALKTGMISLKNDCGEKVINGVTTVDEMLRVTLSENDY
ncbi:Flp pilus assembly complex ATPase component TadA [bacterium]|nr:Flp pilus assembly complex ATPase component TadA [bacterium]